MQTKQQRNKQWLRSVFETAANSRGWCPESAPRRKRGAAGSGRCAEAAAHRAARPARRRCARQSQRPTCAEEMTCRVSIRQGCNISLVPADGSVNWPLAGPFGQGSVNLLSVCWHGLHLLDGRAEQNQSGAQQIIASLMMAGEIPGAAVRQRRRKERRAFSLQDSACPAEPTAPPPPPPAPPSGPARSPPCLQPGPNRRRLI